jgi:outer membrane protein assembly factor BamB
MFIGLAALVLVTSACTTDWTTWGGGPERQSYNPIERTLTPGNVGGLRHLWSVDVGGAYVNSGPIYAKDVDVDGAKKDLIFVGNEHGYVTAVDTAGRIVWTRLLGSNVHPTCNSTGDNIYGVAASGVYDRGRNRVYFADGDGKAWALNASTGATIAGWPVTISTDGVADVVESAPTLFGNHLYFETASYCDYGDYHGRIDDINPATATITKTWFTATGTGTHAGGIWGWGGASVDPKNGDVYVTTGNVGGAPENTPYGDAVVRLSGALQVKASFTPSPLIGDDDFGSTPMLFQADGCPPQLVTMQKNGTVFLFDRDSIANGPRQSFVFAQPNLIGEAAWSPVTQTVYLLNSKGSPDGRTYVRGLAAFKLNSSCVLQSVWQTPVAVGVAVSPLVANGVVYFTGGFSGKVYAVDAANGTPLWNSGTSISGAINAAPIVVNGRLYAAGYDHRLHAWGL